MRGRLNNIMTEVREITGNHEYEEIRKQIVLSRKKIGGTTPVSPERYNSLERETQNNDNAIIGYFEDDKLISWIHIGFHESKMRGKFWVISNFFSSVYTSYFSFNRPEFGMLFKAAFGIAESRGYFQYFYCIAERLERVYERQWKKNTYAIQGKYDLTTLAVVPANTKPEFELYWRLMGQELKPDNIVIKSRKLKSHNLPGK
jgi:hypothetical protein